MLRQALGISSADPLRELDGLDCPEASARLRISPNAEAVCRITGRTNTILLVLILAVGVAIVAMLASNARGGPLDPPGTPASTSGVLQPGTPITSLPFDIQQPGNYYLTRNLTIAAAGNGITIDSSNVTLDLGGFTIDGAHSGYSGVYIQSPIQGSFNLREITVRDGTARNWTQDGFDIEWVDGLIAEDLHADGNGTGIVVANGRLSDCTADRNVGAGVRSPGGSTIWMRGQEQSGRRVHPVEWLDASIMHGRQQSGCGHRRARLDGGWLRNVRKQLWHRDSVQRQRAQQHGLAERFRRHSGGIVLRLRRVDRHREHRRKCGCPDVGDRNIRGDVEQPHLTESHHRHERPGHTGGGIIQYDR